MVVVYLDVLFLLNLFMNYIILLMTARFSGIYARRRRLLVGALVGAVFSVVMFFPALHAAVALLFKVLLCVAVVVTAFGIRSWRETLRLCAAFLGITGAFAGLVYAINGAQALQNGSFYIDVSLKTLLLASGVAYLALSLIFGKGSMEIRRLTREVELKAEGNSVTIRALADSGNLLREPISGKKVLLVGAETLAPVLDRETWRILCETRDPVERFSRLSAQHGTGFGMIPYRTCGEEGGMVVSLRHIAITVDQTRAEDYVVGVLPSEVETPDGCHAIIGM